MNLEISNIRKTGKDTNMWKLSNTLLHNQQDIEEIARGIRKYLEVNENKDTIYQKLWAATKLVFRGKFIAAKVYVYKARKI